VSQGFQGVVLPYMPMYSIVFTMLCYQSSYSKITFKSVV